MADIYNRAGQAFGGAFAADAASIVFATGGTGSPSAGISGGVGLLSQNFSISYTQQITRLYEIGSNFTFLVAGRTQGQMSLARILGPRPVQVQFYQNYGNVCNAANNNLNLTMATGCPTGTSNAGNTGDLAKLNLLVQSVVLVSIGFSVGAGDMVINEQVQAMFVSLAMQ